MTHYTTNEILRSLRYALNVNEKKLIHILELAEYIATEEELLAYLLPEGSVGYEACPDVVLSRFLDGLIAFKRGKREGADFRGYSDDSPITNNIVLKKIRIAFELKDSDLITLIEKSGLLKISKTELTAFFRRPDHRNFRICGDQYLRNVLKGLG